MRTIIAELDGTTWTAWVEGNPCYSFAGDSAGAAITRLCEAAGIDQTTLACQYSRTTANRMEFVPAMGPCPDCGGKGTYTGLLEIEDCPTCCGSGRV